MMMKRQIGVILASGIALSGAISATESQIPKFNSSKPQRHSQDLLLLNDGTLLRGKITFLPSLRYEFGKYPLKQDEVLSISQNSGRWIVLTNQGRHLSARFSEPTLRFQEGQEEREIPFEEIESFYPAATKEQLRSGGYQLTFANGDQIPVDLMETRLLVTDGKNKREILAEEIDEVTFNGGLQGTLRDRKGNISRLPLCFVCQQHITVKFPNQETTIRLPWSTIDRLEKVGEQERSRLVIQSSQDREQLSQPKPILSLLKNEFDFQEVTFEEEEEEQLPETKEETQKPATTEETRKPHASFNINMIAYLEELEVYPQEAADRELFMPLEEVAIEKEEQQPLPATQEKQDVEEPEEAEDEEEDDEDEDENEESSFVENIEEQAPPIVPENPEQIPEKQEMNPEQVPEKEEEPEEEKEKETVYEKTCYVADTSGSGFYIERKKVSNREYEEFVRAVGYKAPAHWKGGVVSVGEEEKPVVNVTYRDVLLYAIWSGKKLPTWPQLQVASVTPTALLDCEDGLNEWTCSMESSNNKTAFKTFGKKHELIVNGERNMHTGFRLIAE